MEKYLSLDEHDNYKKIKEDITNQYGYDIGNNYNKSKTYGMDRNIFTNSKFNTKKR